MVQVKIMGEDKKYYQSKTIIINTLIVLAGVASALAGELQAGSTLTTLGVVNIILRVITNSGIKF